MNLPTLKTWQWATLGGLGIAGLWALSKVSGSGSVAGGTGTIFTIVFENKGYSEVLGVNGPTNAPFFTSLAAQYGNAVNYYSPVHPSLPNYIVMTSGTTGGITDDTGFRIPGTNNLAAQMDAAGVPWRAYAESMPAPCSMTDTNLYAPRHVPFLYYDYVRNDPNYCAQKVVPFTQFWSDLDSNAYRYMWITPNMCNDMHDCSVSQGDTWLQSVLPAIMNSAGYQNGGVIFILFDEGEGGQDTIPCLVISNNLVQPGVPDNTRYGHASYLAAVEDILGLPRLTASTGVGSLASMLR